MLIRTSAQIKHNQIWKQDVAARMSSVGIEIKQGRMNWRSKGQGEVHVEDDDGVGVGEAEDPAGHIPSREAELAGAADDGALRGPRQVELAPRRQRAAAVLTVVAGEDKVDGRQYAGAVQRRVHAEALRPADEPRRRVRALPQLVVEHLHVPKHRRAPAGHTHAASFINLISVHASWSWSCVVN